MGDWSNLHGDPALPTGPLSSILVTRFGCRPVMLAGGLLASAGMILASFASRLLELYLTAGVLTGEGTQGSPLGVVCSSGVPAVSPQFPPKGRPPSRLAQHPGLGPIPPVGGPARTSSWDQEGHPSQVASPAGLGLALNFQPSLIMLGLYFERRRPLANGLAAAGSPVFLSALSPLGQLLGERFGWRGGFLLFGGLLLHCCACGAVMRPPPGPPLRPDPAEDHAPSGGRARRRRLLDVAVCTDRTFVVYVVTKFLMALGLFVPAILLVNYAKDAGVPDAEAAFLLSIVGFVDIVARPACGALAGLSRLRPHVPYLFSLALLANGLTDLISARARSYGTLVAFCIAFGLSYGMVGALQFEVLMATVGAPRFPSALGLVLLVEAVAVLIGPPSAGRLVDALKNYEIIFYLAGSEVALAGVFMAVTTYCCLRCSKDIPSDPSAEGGTSDTEDVEAERESEPIAARTEEPGSLEALEVLSRQAGSPEPEPEVEAVPELGHESVGGHEALSQKA